MNMEDLIDQNNCSEMKYPPNDIPAMQEIIKRKLKLRDILFADLLIIYRHLPSGMQRMIKKLKKRIKL